MIISVPVIIKDLFKQGRNYIWERPEKCLQCECDKVWGHGFVTAIFDGFDDIFWLKRYRCPFCKCIIKLKPKGFFKRFQAPIETIRHSILCKTVNQQWLPGICRNRQGHWYRALKRKILAYLCRWQEKINIKAFDEIYAIGIIPVSRSFNLQQSP